MTIIKSYTDLQQSKKLEKILPLESADNVIVSFGSREGTKTVVMPKETLDVFRTPFADIRETTMCWSLAALLSVLPKCIGGSVLRMDISENDFNLWFDDLSGIVDENLPDITKDNSIDACYEMILKLNKQKLL